MPRALWRFGNRCFRFRTRCLKGDCNIDFAYESLKSWVLLQEIKRNLDYALTLKHRNSQCRTMNIVKIILLTYLVCRKLKSRYCLWSKFVANSFTTETFSAHLKEYNQSKTEINWANYHLIANIQKIPPRNFPEIECVARDWLLHTRHFRH